MNANVPGLWHVQPWYPEGDQWEDEPGMGSIVEAPTRQAAIAIYEDHNPDDHQDHYRIVRSRAEITGSEWSQALRRPILKERRRP